MVKGIRATTRARESNAGFNMRDEMLAAQLMGGFDENSDDGEHEDGKASLSRKLGGYSAQKEHAAMLSYCTMNVVPCSALRPQQQEN